MNGIIVNWKTSLCGTLLAIGVALSQLDPALYPGWEISAGKVIAFFATVALGIFSRDYNKSSEQSGAGGAGRLSCLLPTAFCLLALSGCASTQAARNNEVQAALANGYAAKVTKREQAFVNDWRAMARQMADEKFDKAIAAEADGPNHAANVNALLVLKFQAYGAIENQCVLFRQQFDEDRADIVMLDKYNTALSQYFGQVNSVDQIISSTTASVLADLATFFPSAAPAKPKSVALPLPRAEVPAPK